MTRGAPRLLGLVLGLLSACDQAPTPEAARPAQPPPARVDTSTPAPLDVSQTPVVPPPDAWHPIELSAAYHNTFALLKNGHIRAWGQGQHGQLAAGRLPTPYPGGDLTLDAAMPADIGVDDAIHVASGYPTTGQSGSTACAIHRDDTVSCWGDDALIPDPSLAGDVATPIRVPALDGARQLVFGLGFGCARRADGSAACWGHNYNAELGDDRGEGSRIPRVIEGLGGLRDLGAGRAHACAVTTEGAIFCWGDNRQRAAAPAFSASKIKTPIQVKVRPGARAVAVEASEKHTCALFDDAAVYCWGGEQPAAAKIATNAIALTGGGGHFCLLHRDGEVACWGDNRRGQLGFASERSWVDAPGRVGGLSGVIAIAAGHTHTCAATREGSVYCWGSNRFGELGDATLIDRASPTRTAPVDDPSPRPPNHGFGLQRVPADGVHQDWSRKPRRCDMDATLTVEFERLYHERFEVRAAYAELKKDESVHVRIGNYDLLDGQRRWIAPRGDQLYIELGFFRVDDPDSLAPRQKSVKRGVYLLDPMSMNQLIPWATGFRNSHTGFSLNDGDEPAHGEVVLSLVNVDWMCGEIDLVGRYGRVRGTFIARFVDISKTPPRDP